MWAEPVDGEMPHQISEAIDLITRAIYLIIHHDGDELARQAVDLLHEARKRLEAWQRRPEAPGEPQPGLSEGL